MDLFPREGKYGHAMAADVIKRSKINGQFMTPVAMMVANFNKPTTDIPSLLTHYELHVFYHEFGHLMHELLSENEYASLSGFSVEMDFIECPS